MDVPVDVTPDEARDAAVRELSDPAYAAARPGPLRQALDWLLDRLNELFGVSGGAGGLVVLLLALAVGVVVTVRVTRRVQRSARSHAVFTDRRTAQDHRNNARQAFDRGDFAEAVRERFRALVRELELKGVLDERAGRTVDEVAADAGRELPAHQKELRHAAVLFDDIWYGGRTATESAYQVIATLDDEVRR